MAFANTLCTYSTQNTITQWHNSLKNCTHSPNIVYTTANTYTILTKHSYTMHILHHCVTKNIVQITSDSENSHTLLNKIHTTHLGAKIQRFGIFILWTWFRFLCNMWRILKGTLWFVSERCKAMYCWLDSNFNSIKIQQTKYSYNIAS